jgi:hypothetical protein
MARGTIYRTVRAIEVIREGVKLPFPLTINPTDRFRCTGGTRSTYRFGRELCWGRLAQVCGELNGEPFTFRVTNDEPAVWLPVEVAP